MVRCLWIILLLCALPGLASLAAINGYESLANWSDLPRAKVGMTAGLASSFDRNGQNYDYNWYLQPQGWQQQDASTVVTQLSGPGILTRFWMPHATASCGFTERLIIDGTTAIDTTSSTLLNGTFGYMTSPLVRTSLGGQVSYEPIAFQNSLRIESRNFGTGSWAQTHHYYQWNYRALPSNTVVTAYSGSLTPEQQAARSAIGTMIAAVGSNPAGPSTTSVTLSQGARTIPAGSTLVLADLAGGGLIRSLHVKMASGATDAQMDGLKVRVHYDGLPINSIDVPVSHFFGAGHGRAAYRSLPLGTDSPDGCYCYWPMPYRQGVVVALFNGTALDIPIDSAKVEYESVPPPQDAGYLCAAYNEEHTSPGQAFHVLLAASGRGHYVGNLLYVEAPGDSRSILEGDDTITVNPGAAGETVLQGTGMEDAYNGGYYYNHVLEQTDHGDVADPAFGIGPYHGLLYMDFYDVPGFVRTRTDQYRWMIGDYVPFTHGINVKIENYAARADILFGSTAFYYAVPGMLGDISGDGYVDVDDLLVLAGHWGSSLGGPGFDLACDLNGDGVVNVVDLLILAEDWGA
jgi:hypothetical protein